MYLNNLLFKGGIVPKYGYERKDIMSRIGKGYKVELLDAHVDWGVFRNPTNRPVIEGESYVKIPASEARRLNLVRGSQYKAHFDNGHPVIDIKAAGNGPCERGVQYAKQFEGIGRGACKAFTSWFESINAKVGDEVRVEFITEEDILFTKE